MSEANDLIKQAAIDWFGADWRRAAGFGGYVRQELRRAGYTVVQLDADIDESEIQFSWRYKPRELT